MRVTYTSAKLLILGPLMAPISAIAQNAAPARITSVTAGGVGYVTHTSSERGVTASIGRWDTPYPYPDTGEPAPDLEPYGYSILTINVDVYDGGLVSFSFRLRTYDAGIYDWFDAALVTPTETISLIDHLGKPGSAYGTYWESSLISLSMSLNEWRNETVQFVFAVAQDGWGDQTVAEIVNFDVRTCQVPPLNPISDHECNPAADTDGLTSALRTAQTCLQSAVTSVGGTYHLNSAYRAPEYQTHLREVWDRWKDLRNRREPECAELRQQVEAEFTDCHHLLLSQRPAASSAHTRGEAFDASTTLPSGQNIDTLAETCGLTRPYVRTDPVHFQLRP